MSAVFDRPSPWQRIRPIFSGFDGPLLLAMLLLALPVAAYLLLHRLRLHGRPDAAGRTALQQRFDDTLPFG